MTNRREFLERAGGGLGAVAVLMATRPGRSSGLGRFVEPAIGPAAAFPPQGDERHLSVHARRPEPSRDVRPQARPAATGRPAAAGQLRAGRHPAARWRHNPLLATRRTFRKCGQSGIEISDFLPHLAECADDLAVIRSCWADSVNHPQAVYQMNTGSILMGKPSLGSWVSYGLGTENQDLPAFVVLARSRRRHQGRPAGLWRGLPAGEPPGDRRCAAAIAADPRPAPPEGMSRRRPAAECST